MATPRGRLTWGPQAGWPELDAEPTHRGRIHEYQELIKWDMGWHKRMPIRVTSVKPDKRRRGYYRVTVVGPRWAIDSLMAQLGLII